jgi:hypothetical protein
MIPRSSRFLRCLSACLLFPAVATAELPPEGRCPAMSAGPGSGPAEDAAPTGLREGMVLDYSDLLALRSLFPAEVWRNREVFFFEGMSMEIGPCHRRYPVPSFYSAATKEFGGQARVDDEGNLLGYVAGVPFPQDWIDPSSPDAAVQWAWNLSYGYRGAGPSGSFRLVDMPSRIGSPETYLGDFFLIQTRHRADLAASDYTVSAADDTLFVSGGSFAEPFNARHLAWRQMRPEGALRKYSKSDDTFVYVPTMRKVRRAITPWIDGMYTPSYRIGGENAGGALAVGDTGGYAPSGALNLTSARQAAITEHLPRGFRDLSFRPNAYVWRYRGEQEVLAPINSGRPGYPNSPNRNFGPAGLSVASDRWDVRWAIVIEGLPRRRGESFDRVTYYIDYQSLKPLYLMTKRDGGRLYDVGIPVHRFSGDVFDYPPWPNGERALVFDPVAAVFYNAAEGGSGWRRESYDATSTPPEAAKLRRFVTPDALARGH